MDLDGEVFFPFNFLVRKLSWARIFAANCSAPDRVIVFAKRSWASV